MRMIDADEAVRAVHDEFDECLVWDESGETTANEVENIILQIPTVDPVKRGRWITVSDGYGNGVATASICECSLCKDTVWVYKDGRRKWHYCPNCGAYMEVEDETD